MTSEIPVCIVLVATGVVGSNGSMPRYARLVEHALREHRSQNPKLEITSIQLGLSKQWVSWLPGSVQAWLIHFCIMLTARARLSRTHADLVHILDGSYAYLLNRLSGLKTVVTVHDLIPLLQQRGVFGPDVTSFLARWIVGRTIAGLRRCSSLISVSENTRQDLIRFAAIGAHSITVVPIALDSIYTEALAGTFAARPPETGETSPLVLHVGNNGQYKNREGVLRIFARISSSTGARLKLVGPRPTASLLRLVEELGVQDRVEFIGNVDDQTLCGLYQSASLLLFPSLYEGFGWPPLEAMACGCPVVCSSGGSLAEVVGDAALTAPAGDEEALARLCLEVLKNPEVAADLRTRGREHARRFTLKRMGEQLLEVYASILDEAQPLRDRGRTLTARTGT